jgi:hypothetical protein
MFGAGLARVLCEFNRAGVEALADCPVIRKQSMTFQKQSCHCLFVLDERIGDLAPIENDQTDYIRIAGRE